MESTYALQGRALNAYREFAGEGVFRISVGLEDPEAARVVALLGVLGFTLIWSAFLVFGNWFLIWMCHEWAQSNHFQLLLWGIGTMLLLILGS